MYPFRNCKMTTVPPNDVAQSKKWTRKPLLIVIIMIALFIMIMIVTIYFIIFRIKIKPVIITGCVNDNLTGCAVATSSTAYLTGMIDTLNHPNYYFEYGPISNPTEFMTTKDLVVTSSVSRLITGLIYNQDYQFLLIVIDGSSYAGDWQHFHTLDQPELILNDINDVTDTTANVTGLINPKYSMTLQYWFEYGTAIYPYYYVTTPQLISPEDQVNNLIPLSMLIQGLLTNVTYKARIVADERDDNISYYTLGKYFQTK